MPKPKRKPKVQDVASNEQKVDSGSDDSRRSGGFDPLLGFNVVGSAVAVGYIANKAMRSAPPKLQIVPRKQTVQEDADYYLGQANALKRQAAKMDHPSFSTDSSGIPLNRENQIFNKIYQLKIIDQSNRYYRRAAHFSAHAPGNRLPSIKNEIKDPFKKPKK